MKNIIFELINKEDYSNYTELWNDKTYLTLEEMKSHILEMGSEYEYDILKGDAWSEFIMDGFSGFKETEENPLSVNTVFALATSVLSVQSTDVYKIVDKEKDIKIKLEYNHAIPDSIKDDAQYYYQDGASDMEVSTIGLYKNGVHILNYGAEVKGKQTAICSRNESDEFVPIDVGENDEISGSPEEFLELKALDNNTSEDYLVYENNCWLEAFYTDVNNKDIGFNIPKLNNSRECAFDRCSENIDLELDTLEILIDLTKKSNILH